MCCCRRADLRAGAYLTSPDGLFRVQCIRPGPSGVSEVALSDESVPLETVRLTDPDRPGDPARYRLAEPEPVMVPTHRVLRDYDLLRHGPDPADVASVEEWGTAG